MTRQSLLQEERESISELGVQMLERDLTTGTGGNISASDDQGNMAISPTGMDYRDITATDVPILSPEDDVIFSNRDPSSEHRMHRMLHKDHEDISGVVHTHSPYASAFASVGEPIPASHYLIAFAGKQVPVADYATYGTVELGNLAAETIDTEHNACLLQNHGVIAVGESPHAAFEIALMVEYCAKNHYIASHIGDPIILSDEEIDRVQSKFTNYGQSQ